MPPDFLVFLVKGGQVNFCRNREISGGHAIGTQGDLRGQSHLNSDATSSPRRAPTRGAPTDCLLSAFGLGRAPTRGAPTDCLLSAPWEGHPQGVPLPIVFSRRLALGRADYRLSLGRAFCPGKGTHKGCPYRLSSLGVWPWEGHPQGVPLPVVFSRRLALGRAPTRGAPTDCLVSAFGPGKGTHKGRPYRLSSLGVWPWEGHPQGAPLPVVFSRCLALGRAFVFSRPWEGRPQGVPLPIVLSWRFGLGRAPTRGAPTGCLLSAFGPGKGTHKGCPYRLSSLGVWPWEGRLQGAPLPDSGSLTWFFLILCNCLECDLALS